MKTSYFAKFSRLNDEEKNKYYPIAISTTIPKWFKDYREHHTFISPPNNLPFRYKNGDISWEEFTKEYIEFLDELEKIQSIYDYYKMIELEENKEIVLLCYESTKDNCHRHILSDYIERKNNIIIEEV